MSFGTLKNFRALSTRTVAVGMSIALVAPLTACGSDSAPTDQKVGSNIEEIEKLAKEEKEVRLMGYTPTWANYKGSFEEFKKKYGLNILLDGQESSSAEELQAVKNLKGQAKQPDVLDIGYSFTNPAIQQNLVEPYKPTNWDSIPDNMKDPDGKWVGAYYGVISVGVNKKNADVPKNFKDLLDPKYKGKIALPGDPRSGAFSIATVFAAALANGGSLDDIGPGIDFFAKLAASGNLVPTTDPLNALETGEASVVFDWNYNWKGVEKKLKDDGVDFEAKVLPDGVFGNYYAQPITISPQHPNAARLWVNWLTSDEGSEQYALGGAVPARFDQLVKENKLSKEALDSLPEPDVLKKVQLPTAQQGDKANKVIASEWAQKVKY